MSMINSLMTFITYAIVALAAQNVLFTRSLGVSRLIKLVEDGGAPIKKFTIMLAAIQLITAPIAFYSTKLVSDYIYKDAIRPLILVLSSSISFFVILGVIALMSSKTQLKDLKDYINLLPMATFNCCIIGTLLLTTTSDYTFLQTLGFSLGSALGYVAAIILVEEGQRKIQNRNIPASFKGLPITLIYIGVLALSIFGFTGHMPAI